MRGILTDTREDYIRAIYLLCQKECPVRVKAVAGYLHLRTSTVSERLQELADQKLITFKKYSRITLTSAGNTIVKKLTHRHRLIEVFLFKMLRFPKDKLHAETDRMEHGFSDEAVRRLDRFLKYPRFDPHGKIIKK